MKYGTKFQKVFEAFAARIGVHWHTLRFHYDGEQILEDRTPLSYSMQDNDEIDVIRETVGC